MQKAEPRGPAFAKTVIGCGYDSDCWPFRLRFSTLSTTFSPSGRKKLLAAGCCTATCVPVWPRAEAISFQRYTVEFAGSTTGFRTCSGAAQYAVHTPSAARIMDSYTNCSGAVSEMLREISEAAMKSLADIRPNPSAIPNAISRTERRNAFM